MKAKFSAAMMRWVSPSMGKRDIRAYLNGFRVEPHPVKGVLLIATNGHKMSIAYDEDGECDGIMVVAAPPRSCLSMCSKEKDTALMSRKGKTVTIENDRLTLLGPMGQELYLMPGKALIEELNPLAWRRVVPNRDGSGLEPAGNTVVHGKYIADIVSELPLLARGNGYGVRMWRRKAESEHDNYATRPVIMEVCGLPIMAVIMPLYSDFADRADAPAVGWFVEGAKR